jgi:hypothetical protein
MDREALAGLYALTLQEKLEEEEGQDEEGPQWSRMFWRDLNKIFFFS